MKHTTVTDQRIREIKAEQKAAAHAEGRCDPTSCVTCQEDKKKAAIKAMHKVGTTVLIANIDPEGKA